MHSSKKGDKVNTINGDVSKSKLSAFIEQHISPIWSNVLLAVITGFCLKDYYFEVTGKDIQHYAHASYLLVIANSLSGLLKYTNDDTYSDLRILLDYAQQVLCLPLIATDFLLKYNIAPPEIAVIPTILGLVTLLMFVILEYKRQDLTDLNIILSVAIYLITGIEYNVHACIAAFLTGCAYFTCKRREGIYMRKANQYNLLMTGFVFFSLLSLDKKSYSSKVIHTW